MDTLTLINLGDCNKLSHWWALKVQQLKQLNDWIMNGINTQFRNKYCQDLKKQFSDRIKYHSKDFKLCRFEYYIFTGIHKEIWILYVHSYPQGIQRQRTPHNTVNSYTKSSVKIIRKGLWRYFALSTLTWSGYIHKWQNTAFNIGHFSSDTSNLNCINQKKKKKKYKLHLILIRK